jgi:hypothetical protein
MQREKMGDAEKRIKDKESKGLMSLLLKIKDTKSRLVR